MTAGAQIEGLLIDLQTIADTARAGVISKRDEVLEPGETRPAAILFVDIVGFTPLARRLSSEVLAKVVDRTFRIFELTVRAHGGYCDKVMGDAALYVFAGHPNYPPVCEAALKAALKLQDRLRQINESLGETEVSLAIRQGVAFGEVTRQAVGAEQAQLTVLGDTVNQAQRLQSTAQPDTILTTRRVLEKAGDAFTREELEPVELKGIGWVTAHRVTGVEEQPVQLRGAFRQLSPLVGREAELEQAVTQIKAWLATRYPPDTWDITQMSMPLQGRNRLLILRGVPAVGKSRLAYEIVQAVGARRDAPALGGSQAAPTATAHCAENAMLAQFTAELARVAELTAENLPERWEELCAHAAQAVSSEYAERQRGHLRLLAYVLGCRAIDASAIGQADPQSFAISCQLALRACCELAALEGKPVILVIEDLQWLGGFRDVLADVLARACLPWPLVVIGTARPDYAPSEEELGKLVGAKPSCVQDGAGPEEGEARVRPYHIIELGALSRVQGDVLVQVLLPGLALPDAVADELHEKAAGIPYFYEDFVRMLVRKGIVEVQGGQWRLTRQLRELGIPDDLQAMMLGRLDQMGTEVRELVRHASVLGRRFQRDMLYELERRLGSSYRCQNGDELSGLIRERLIYQEQDNLYCFEHALMHEAAYASLLGSNRRLLHSIAADVLGERIITGSLSEVQLLPEQVVHLNHASRYAEEHAACCQVLLGLVQSGSPDEWEQWEQRAHISLEKCGSEVPGAPRASTVLHRAQAQLRLRRGEYQAAARLYTQALDLAKGAQDALNQAKALVGLGILSRHSGDTVQALRQFEEALDLAKQCGNRPTEGLILNNIGLLAYFTEQPERAAQFLDQGLAIAQEVGNLRSEANCLVYLGTTYADAGRNQEAFRAFSHARSIAQALGDRLLEIAAMGNMGVVLHNIGMLDEALALYEQALEINRALGQRSGVAFNLYNMGVLALEQEKLELSRDCYIEALGHFRSLGDMPQVCTTLAELGRIYAHSGMLAQSRTTLTEAQDLCNHPHNKQSSVIVACSWVYYYVAAGMLAEAGQELANVDELAAGCDAGAGTPLGIEIERAHAAYSAALLG